MLTLSYLARSKDNTEDSIYFVQIMVEFTFQINLSIFCLEAISIISGIWMIRSSYFLYLLCGHTYNYILTYKDNPFNIDVMMESRFMSNCYSFFCKSDFTSNRIFKFRWIYQSLKFSISLVHSLVIHHIVNWKLELFSVSQLN